MAPIKFNGSHGNGGNLFCEYYKSAAGISKSGATIKQMRKVFGGRRHAYGLIQEHHRGSRRMFIQTEADNSCCLAGIKW